MKKTTMKAYMDSHDRLIIIIDEPGTGLTELVKSFLGGSLPEVQHLDAPAPMQMPDISTEGMEEITPTQQVTKPAKFIRSKETTGVTSNGKVTAATAAPTPVEKLEQKEPDKKCSTPSEESTSVPEMNLQLIECMTVFELQDYLRSKGGDHKLIAILTERMHAPLDFILNTKSEREIRAIAQELAN